MDFVHDAMSKTIKYFVKEQRWDPIFRLKIRLEHSSDRINLKACT